MIYRIFLVFLFSGMLFWSSVPVFSVAPLSPPLLSSRENNSLTLGIPVDCPLRPPLEAAQSDKPLCHIAHYVDHDTSADTKDYKGGRRSYSPGYADRNFHRGIDFSLLDKKALDTANQPVMVVAAAAGTVYNVRDGQGNFTSGSGPACGNRVMINHGNNLITLYCHLSPNSLRVKNGDTVLKGQAIGAIGASGRANFPHLHFGVLEQRGDNALYLDPFLPGKSPETSPDQAIPLVRWEQGAMEKMVYRPVEIIKAGFVTEAPTRQSLRLDLRAVDTLSWNEFGPIFPFLYISGAFKGYKIAMDVRSEEGDILFSGTRILDEKPSRHMATANIRNSKSFKAFMIRDGRAPLGTLTLFYQVRTQRDDILASGSVSVRLDP